MQILLYKYIFIYMHLLILLKKKMKNLNIRYILYNIIDNIIIRKIYLEDQIEDKNFKVPETDNYFITPHNF